MCDSNLNINQVQYNVPTHGKAKHSIKWFTIADPKMWSEQLTDEQRGDTIVHVLRRYFKIILSIIVDYCRLLLIIVD